MCLPFFRKKEHQRMYDYHPRPAMGHAPNYNYYNSGKKSRRYGGHGHYGGAAYVGGWGGDGGGGHGHGGCDGGGGGGGG
ncbi:hypothetical protein FSARC_14047, partial [Fusarium sarcochroum]